MGGSAPKPAPPPDPAKTAAAQGAANVDAAVASALLNNINTTGPGGSTTFDQTGTQTIETANGPREIPKFSQTTTLGETQQETFDLQQQLAKMLAGTANQQASFLPTDKFSLDGIPNAPGANDFVAERDAVTNAVFNRRKALLDPQFEDQSKALDQQLSDRGIPITGEDATRQLDRFDQSRNLAFQDAADSAVAAGGAEQNRLFNLSNTARNQAISDVLLERNQPINELAAALQGSPAISGPQAPGFQGAGINPADVMGAQAMALQQSNFNAQNRGPDRFGQALGLAGSLGGAALLSDIRLKSNIKFLERINGFNWYSYIMDGMKRVGVLAQEVMLTNPELVHVKGDYFAVDYRGVING